MVPFDKTTSNIAFICKQFYTSVIAKGVGLGLNNTTNIYSEIYNTSKDEIINTNREDLKSEFGIAKIAMDNNCLSNMYWLPKMYKAPIKARFIVASPKSKSKPLAEAITSAFQLFYKQIEVFKCFFKCLFKCFRF